MLIRKIVRTAMLGVAVVTLTGCVSAPLFHPQEENTVGFRGHIQTRIESDARRFSVRSGGEIVGARDSPRTEPWKKISELSTNQFAISLFAPDNEAVLFETVMKSPVAVGAGERAMSDIEILSAGFVNVNKVLMQMLGTRTVKSRLNIYYSRPDSPVKVPFTAWQPGPIVDPVELNLAILMPITVDGQSRLKPENRVFWHYAVVSSFAHEYMHVIQQNAPTPPRAALADEFVAHTVSDCTLMLQPGKFSEASRKSTLEVADEYFQKGRRHYLEQPWALSNTAGDLAVLAESLVFARAELKNAPLTVWQQIAPAYCKYIANVVPDFSTVTGALDWIEKHVYRAKLDFLSSTAQ